MTSTKGAVARDQFRVFELPPETAAVSERLFELMAASRGKAVAPQAAGGPGTELKQLLSRVGIAAEPGCECNTHAAQMDRWGCDECEQRLEEIVGWLQEEHAKRVKARGTILPWSKLVATNIVKLAIRRARRKESTGPN